MAKRIVLIVAAVLVVAGAGLFLAMLATSGWDFSKIGSGEHIETTCPVEGDFRFISIETDTTDIHFAPSGDGTCKVISTASEGDSFYVSVVNETLTVREIHDDRWYDFHIFGNRASITVCLPEKEYEALVIKEKTGDVEIPKDFTFNLISVTASTGDITCYASANNNVWIDTSTGDIKLSDVSAEWIDLTVSTGRVKASKVNCEHDLRISVSTGRTELTDVQCRNLTSTGSTGRVILKNVIAEETLSVKRSTGDVTFDRCDAVDISVETSTGDVTGTLLTDKIFFTDTNTGDVDVPKTTTGGTCEITTTTGDICIEIG